MVMIAGKLFFLRAIFFRKILISKLIATHFEFLDECLLKFWGQSGARGLKSCRSRKEFSNEYSLAKIGVDTAENEALKVWREFGGVENPAQNPTAWNLKCESRCRTAQSILKATNRHGSPHMRSVWSKSCRASVPPPTIFKVLGSERPRWKLNGKLNVRENEN